MISNRTGNVSDEQRRQQKHRLGQKGPPTRLSDGQTIVRRNIGWVTRPSAAFVVAPVPKFVKVRAKNGFFSSLFPA
jgi:hypothetical protein